uniref:Uncharacterized protein n=1 Tax=Rhizophora mucronata TaxID=61149 RepID=A0A2P2MKR0_RHIMU
MILVNSLEISEISNDIFIWVVVKIWELFGAAGRAS